MPKVILRLFTTAKGFPAISYNMKKVESGQAKLLLCANLGMLNAFSNLKTSDLLNYFGAVSALNLRSHYDQFHAVLSTKGKAMPAEELLGYAKSWLEGMGYQHQPYLVFFHEDTHNHHIHIVSTDVRLDRTKIDDSFDRVRGVRILNALCGIDEKTEFLNNISPLLSYRFGSIDQLRLVLKARGYHFYLARNRYVIRRYGTTFASFDAQKMIDGLNRAAIDPLRISALRDLLESGRLVHGALAIPIYQKVAGKYRRRISGYRSDLSDFLIRAAKLELCYSFNRGQLTGFTLIDHLHQQLIDGDQLMPLADLMARDEKRIPQATTPFRR